MDPAGDTFINFYLKGTVARPSPRFPQMISLAGTGFLPQPLPASLPACLASRVLSQPYENESGSF